MVPCLQVVRRLSFVCCSPGPCRCIKPSLGGGGLSCYAARRRDPGRRGGALRFTDRASDGDLGLRPSPCSQRPPFSFIQDGVEKKVRRHLMHARKRKGFGWARWSRQWLYDTLKLFNGNRVVGQSRKSPKKGPVPLEAKQTDERSASSRHV